MARLGFAGWTGAIALGMVVCVAVAPISSWSFKNDFGTVLSRERLGKLFTLHRPGDNQYASEGPAGVLDARQISKDTKASRLARALGMAEWGRGNDFGHWEHGVREGLTELQAYCADNPNDAVALAQLVRLLSQSLGSVVPDEKTRANKAYVDESRKLRPVHELMLSYCQRGETLEPHNAFWPFMQCLVQLKLEHFVVAKEAFLRASLCDRYADYGLNGPQVSLAELDKRWGYRGEAVRMVIPAGAIFPHYAGMKAAFKRFCIVGDSPDELKTRWAGIRLAHLIARDGDTVIAILVARAAMAIAVVGNEKMPVKLKRDFKSEERVRAIHRWEQGLANQVDGKLAAIGVSTGQEGAGAKFAYAQRLLLSVPKAVDYEKWDKLVQNPFAGANATALTFAAVLLAIPLGGLIWLWVWRAPEAYDRSRLLLIGLLAFFGLAMIRFGFQGTEESPRVDADILVFSLFVIYAVLFGTALLKKSSKTLMVMCGSAAVVVPLLCGLIGPIWSFTILFGLMNALFLFLALKMPTHWLTSAVVAGMVATVVYTLVSKRYIDPAEQYWESAWGIVLLLFCAPSGWFRNWAAISALALSLCYVGATAYSLKLNEEFKPLNVHFMNETRLVREAANSLTAPAEDQASPPAPDSPKQISKPAR